MADVLEHVHQGRENLIEWELREDGDALTAGELDRVVLTLTERTSGDVVAVDTDAAGVTLGADGHVRWAVPILTLQLGALVPSTIPVGTYDAELVTYDENNPDGVRWARSQAVVICAEDS